MKGRSDVCEEKAQTFLRRSKKGQKYDTYLPMTFSKLPSGHGKHFSLPVTAAKVPGEQDLHCEAEVEPVASPKVPGEQEVQLTPPATSW